MYLYIYIYIREIPEMSIESGRILHEHGRCSKAHVLDALQTLGL